MIRGYITGTFDLVHADHFRLLRSCKAHCDYLIVGLVTDELGEQQKRRPILLYDHRRTILENSKYVDLVVQHHGEPKEVAHDYLKFDVLFSSSEYFSSDEHRTFEERRPSVECVYFPKNSGISTTQISDGIARRFRAQRVLGIGMGGPITCRDGVVTKSIRFTALENDQFDYSDVFGMYKNGLTPPRNMAEDPEKFPMIPGVNANREVYANLLFKDHPWCTYLSHEVVYEDTTKLRSTPPVDSRKSLAQYIASLQVFPAKIVFLHQKFVPLTCFEYFKTCSESQRNHVIEQVSNIIQDMKENDFVHGDLHARNLLIDEDGKAYVIDFGWCSSSCFDLSKTEQKEHDDRVHNSFDFQFFLDSLPGV